MSDYENEPNELNGNEMNNPLADNEVRRRLEMGLAALPPLSPPLTRSRDDGHVHTSQDDDANVISPVRTGATKALRLSRRRRAR